jgi:hypothetical protein
VNGERFKVAAGIDALHVPYRGSGALAHRPDGRRIQYTFDAPSVTLNLINGGRSRRRGAATEQLPNAGNIPTFAEAGLPFIVSSWIGMLAPPNTPPAIVDKLNRTAIEAMSLPETRAASRAACSSAAEAPPTSPDHPRGDRLPGAGAESASSRSERRGTGRLIVGPLGAKGVLFEPFGAPASEAHP